MEAPALFCADGIEVEREAAALEDGLEINDPVRGDSEETETAVDFLALRLTGLRFAEDFFAEDFFAVFFFAADLRATLFLAGDFLTAFFTVLFFATDFLVVDFFTATMTPWCECVLRAKAHL